MYQIENAPKDPVTSLGSVMKFVSGRPIISIVGKLPRVQVDPVWPISFLPSCEKRNKQLVLPFTCQSEAAHISAAGQKPRDRI